VGSRVITREQSELGEVRHVARIVGAIADHYRSGVFAPMNCGLNLFITFFMASALLR